MQKPIITAKNKLLTAIALLEQRQLKLNSKELIDILESLKSVYKNPDLLNTIIHSLYTLLGKDLSHKSELTKRENEVILLIGEGFKNSKIAHELNLSTATIETHRKNIRKKLKLKAQDNLLVFAIIYTLQYKENKI